MLDAEALRIRASEGLVLTDEAEAAIRADDAAQEVKDEAAISDTARLREQHTARMAEFDQARDDHAALMRAIIASTEALVQSSSRLQPLGGSCAPRASLPPLRSSFPPSRTMRAAPVRDFNAAVRRGIV